MNKYLKELADDLLYMKSEEYNTLNISYYADERTDTHEDFSEYYLWIPIRKRDIAAKAINEETDETYTYQICYQVDTKQCLFGVLGDGNLEDITSEVDADVKKIFKDYIESCIDKHININ